MTTTEKTTIDLLKGKKWSPNSNMIRFYFDRNFVQVNISKGCAYYKTYGLEMNETTEDAVVSQLSFFTGIECERIFKSKF